MRLKKGDETNMAKAPAYVKQAVTLAATFLDADKDAQAGRIVILLRDAGKVAELSAYKALSSIYGAMRVQNAVRMGQLELQKECKLKR